MKNKAPIIVRVKKKGVAAHHGGAWKVAYADFVTALMAFFLVMWLVGQDTAVRKAVAAYFRDPAAFDAAVAAGLLQEGDEAAGATRASEKQDEEALQHLASEIRRALQTMPDLAAIRDQIEIRMTADGLRIELEESAKSCLFDTGSARMTPQAEELFGAIGRELRKLPNGVLVEGHTDSRQYADPETYTNWELSADRANAVRRVMEKSGLQQGQLLEVRGYADRRLRNPADPLDARNRRVSILVRRADRPEAPPEAQPEAAPATSQLP